MAKQQGRQESAVIPERRKHRRFKVSQPVKLEAILNGRYIEILQLEMSGSTIDLGPGGFLARVDRTVLPGVRCRIELGSKDGEEPKSLDGRVIRTDVVDRGFLVALEFNDPEEAAKVLGSSDIGGKETARLEFEPSDGAWDSISAGSTPGDTAQV